jgi:hypothetical protein
VHGEGPKWKEHFMVRKQLVKLAIASAAATMTLGTGAALFVPTAAAGAATSDTTSNFQCECNPVLMELEGFLQGEIEGGLTGEVLALLPELNAPADFVSCLVTEPYTAWSVCGADL